MNGEYVNFNFGISLVSLDMILAAGVVAMVIAAVLSVYHKRCVGAIVRSLIARGATSEERALPVDAIAAKGPFFFRLALRPSATVRRYVQCAGDAAEQAKTGGKKAKKAPFLEKKDARYYIPETLCDRAELRYAAKGTNAVTVGLGLVFIVVLALLLRWLIPQVLGSLDGAITVIKSNMR